MVTFGNNKDILLDKFHSIRLGKVKSDNYLRYFPGGWQGVKKRFGDAFRENLKKTPKKYLIEICTVCDIDFSIVQEISRGDYSRIDSHVVEDLCNAYQYNVNDGFLEPILSDGDKERIYMKIQEDGFTSLCGTRVVNGKLEHAEGSEMPQEVLLKLYVILEALKEL